MFIHNVSVSTLFCSSTVCLHGIHDEIAFTVRTTNKHHFTYCTPLHLAPIIWCKRKMLWHCGPLFCFGMANRDAPGSKKIQMQQHFPMIRWLCMCVWFDPWMNKTGIAWDCDCWCWNRKTAPYASTTMFAIFGMKTTIVAVVVLKGITTCWHNLVRHRSKNAIFLFKVI